jgi:hypothetical protein
MKFKDFDQDIQNLAIEMALAVNGGSWPKDYTSDAQQVGWALKAKWAKEKFGVENETS